VQGVAAVAVGLGVVGAAGDGVVEAFEGSVGAFRKVRVLIFCKNWRDFAMRVLALDKTRSDRVCVARLFCDGRGW
jgi:hypothetical protein